MTPNTDEQIVWTGDLDDDCTALWAGLMLRAEWMDARQWWWAVSDISTDRQIASSNDTGRECTSGVEARSRAESTARNHLRKKK